MSATPGGRGSRSRIVIDVDRLQQERRGGGRGRRRGAPGRGRGLKVLSITALVLGGLAVVALLAGYLWWRSYTRTPAYSLALLIDAAQRDDLRAVEDQLDADSVALEFVPQVVEKLYGGAGGAGAAQQQAQALMGQLRPRVREGVRDEVARAVKGFAEQTGGNLPFVLLAAGISRYVEVTEEGDNAAVLVNVEGRAPVELRMRRDGDRWKVVAIKDETAAASIAARVAPNVPAGGAPAAQPTPARRRRP